jgi:hypothetical protein
MEKQENKINEEEKGDTTMNFKVDKSKEKEDEEDYNNSELNNVGASQNNNLKTENKIRLNPDALKQSKIGTDKDLIQDIKENSEEKHEEETTEAPSFRGVRGHLFTKIDRCFSDRIIMIISLCMLLYSILLLMFSILDLIKIMKSKTNNNYYMNNIVFFVLDVVNISIILIYHMMNYFLKPKEVHNITLLLVILLFIFSLMRCMQYAKKNEGMTAVIIYLCQNFFANLVNGLTLFFFFIDSKKRKNAMHGIEEIINFTELNANANSKKENGLQLDIDNNKVKPATLVEEEDNSNNK